MSATAFYRGYVTGGRRAGQVRRLHILRPTGTRSLDPGKLGYCGTGAWKCRGSDPVLVSPLPATPPEGLAWCPACVGRYAEDVGLLGEIAAEVAAWDPGLVSA
jgi:hypothetical protein